jgi:EAL domain-containing protein (putative c-di-GMP-specific phosphodiesterase class I)
VIAEGIEQPPQARELQRLGCRFGQGFHFARPLDQFAVEALLLAEQRRRHPAPAPASARSHARTV